MVRGLAKAVKHSSLPGSETHRKWWVSLPAVVLRLEADLEGKLAEAALIERASGDAPLDAWTGMGTP